MRVLLHACCGPCLLEPFDALIAEHEVIVYFANPNIHPRPEYVRRRDTLTEHARAKGIEVVEAEYDPVAWMRTVAGLEGDPALRCRACFRVRLSMTAEYAAAMGFDAFATTLTVSPYQDQKAVRGEGEAAGALHGVRFLAADFRERYPQATRRSRELGMYRQSYCGCMLSEMEAEAARAERKRARALERERARGERGG